jgi:hypothetical protein
MVGARATCRVPPFSFYSVECEYARTDSEDTLPMELMYRPELRLQILVVRTVIPVQLFAVVVLHFESNYILIPSAAPGPPMEKSSWPSLLFSQVVGVTLPTP